MISWMERCQVGLYLAAMGGGAILGFLLPQGTSPLRTAIDPLLVALLYATFLAIPFARVRRGFADVRFMACIVVLDFVLVPVVVFALTRPAAYDRPLLVGMLLVLLAPCVDYVVVFTGLAGGDSSRLLAATPLLMLLQMLLLPLYLVVFAGRAVVETIDWAPAVEAFARVVLLPLCLSILTQRIAVRHRFARRAMVAMEAAMVPLTVSVLFAVVASQFARVVDSMGRLAIAVPIYATFLALMPAVGNLVGKAARLDAKARRALAFSGATRNSLVVLPLALSLPKALWFAPIAVVAQTLVELLGMVVFVRIIPRLVRERPV